jgi:hypothetical protein
MSQSTTEVTIRPTIDTDDTGTPPQAKDIQDYEAPDIHGRSESDIGTSYSYVHPSTRSYTSPVSEMPLRRIDDASLTRSDLLDMDSREFEILFARTWLEYAGRDTKKKCRLSGHSDLDPDNEYCGVHAPSNPDRGLDLIVRDDPSLNKDIDPPAAGYELFQLKQYDDTQVSAPEVQSFIGACMTFNGCLSNRNTTIKNAYFVTTSTFSQPALNAIQDFNRNSDLFDIHPISDLDTTVFFRRVCSDLFCSIPLTDIAKNEVINPQLMPTRW